MQCASVTEDGFKILMNRSKVLQGHQFLFSSLEFAPENGLTISSL